MQQVRTFENEFTTMVRKSSNSWMIIDSVVNISAGIVVWLTGALHWMKKISIDDFTFDSYRWRYMMMIISGWVHLEATDVLVSMIDTSTSVASGLTYVSL